MSNVELSLPIRVTDEQTYLMATRIFEKHLSPDLEGIAAARRYVELPQAGSLGESNPWLVELQRALQTESMGGEDIEEIRANFVRADLDYRERFAGGLVDRYKRPGFLQTVPSERDSVAHSVLMDLECPDEGLIVEGPLYRVFEARLYKMRAQRMIALLGSRETDENKGVIVGTKIVVPLGPWAGNYVSLFIPTDSSPVVAWTYDTDGKFGEEDLRRQLGLTLTEAVRSRDSRDLSDRNMALLYAIEAISQVLPSDKRVENMTLGALAKLGSGDPVKQKERIFKAAREYPNLFRPATRNYLEPISKPSSRIHFGI